MNSTSNTNSAKTSSRFFSWFRSSSSARPSEDGQGEESTTIRVSTDNLQELSRQESPLQRGVGSVPSSPLSQPQASYPSPTLRGKRSPLPDSRLRPQEDLLELDALAGPTSPVLSSSTHLSPAYPARRRRSSSGISPLARSVLTSPKAPRSPLLNISDDLQQLSLGDKEEKKEKKKEKKNQTDVTRSAEIPRRSYVSPAPAPVAEPAAFRARSSSFSMPPVSTSTADDEWLSQASGIFARFRSDMAGAGLGHLLAKKSEEPESKKVVLPDPCPLYVAWYERSTAIAPHHWALVAAPDENEESRAMIFQIKRHPGQTGASRYFYEDRTAQLVGQRGSSTYEGRVLLGYLTAEGQELLPTWGQEWCSQINGINEEGGLYNCQNWVKVVLENVSESGCLLQRDATGELVQVQATSEDLVAAVPV